MLTLGFTNHYYTLWTVNTFIKYGRGEVVNGVFNGQCYQVTKYAYLQNLSMDYEEAKAKIALRAGEREWEEDLSLRGEYGSFERTVRMLKAMADWQFTFGQCDGQDMRTSTNVWQLNRAMHEEVGGRRRVYARRRLIELGEVVKYEWTEKVLDVMACADYNWDNPPYIYIKRKYATRVQRDRMEAKKRENEMSGHFFTDGAKVSIEVKEVERFSFDTQFGITTVVKYITRDGKMVKYMGSSAPQLGKENEDGDFIKAEDFMMIKATIKHSEYKGVKETKLQRIKVI